MAETEEYARHRPAQAETEQMFRSVFQTLYGMDPSAKGPQPSVGEYIGQLGKAATAALGGRGGVGGFPKGTKFTSTGIPIRDLPNATVVGHIVKHPESGEELVFAAESGLDALELARKLGVTVKTAYRVK